MSQNYRQWFLIGAVALLALGGGAAVGWLRHMPNAATISADELFATSFPDVGGQSQALAQWKGKALVLNFWATWCPPCREEIPDFISLQSELKDKGLAMVGIAIDDPAAVTDFAKELKINYPLLIGGATGSDFSRALGNSHGALPFTVIIDRQGNVVGAKTGMMTRSALEKVVRPLL